MYAKNIDGKIVRFPKLPKELFFKGEWVQISADNAADFGFIPLVNPDYNAKTHERTATIESTDSGYTYAVKHRGITLDQWKDSYMAELKGYWKRAYEEGKPYMDFMAATNRTVPTDVQAQVSAAYGLLAATKAAIKALDTIEKAEAYELPMEAINAKLAYMEKLI